MKYEHIFELLEKSGGDHSWEGSFRAMGEKYNHIQSLIYTIRSIITISRNVCIYRSHQKISHLPTTFNDWRA